MEKLKPQFKIILFSASGLILAVGLVFVGYKFAQIQQEREQARSRLERLELTRCEQDEDCVVAIRLDQCCSCPKAVSREVFKKDKNLVEYEFGKHYPPFPSEEACRHVVCAPCALWNKAICERGKCKSIFEETKVDCRRLEMLGIEELTQISKTECQKCGGKWEPLSMDLGETGCNPKTSDAGQPCTNYDQCVGVCLAEDESSTSGICSDYKYKLGCSLEFSEGEQVMICRD